MNLQEYSQLIIKDANSAKNHLSFLIGNLEKTDDCGKAILSLYDCFIETYKKTSIFNDVILKFFNNYKVTSDNIKYYNEFSPKWVPNNIEEIKQKNPQWVWEKTQYKNSLEFSRAVIGQRVNIENMFAFLDNNSDTVDKLVKKDKAKLSENFSKNYCWSYMLNHSYSKTKTFCDKFNYDAIDIIKKEYINKQGIQDLTSRYSDNDFFSLFKDLKNVGFDNAFKDTKFFTDRGKENLNENYKNHHNVLDYAIVLILSGKPKQAHYIISTFDESIKELLYSRNYTHNKTNKLVLPTDSIVDAIEKVTKYILELSNGNSSGYHREMKNVGQYVRDHEKNLQAYKDYVNIINFKEKLDDNMVDKKTPSIKRKI